MNPTLIKYEICKLQNIISNLQNVSLNIIWNLQTIYIDNNYNQYIKSVNFYIVMFVPPIKYLCLPPLKYVCPPHYSMFVPPSMPSAIMWVCPPYCIHTCLSPTCTCCICVCPPTKCDITDLTDFPAALYIFIDNLQNVSVNIIWNLQIVSISKIWICKLYIKI